VPTKLEDLAAGLVADRPDVLIGVGGDVVKALFEASKGSTPIVGGVSDDPVRAGIATSLSRPGKNFTGYPSSRDNVNFVESGCFLSYGPSRAIQLRRVAECVEKVIAGAKPENLPVELQALHAINFGLRFGGIKLGECVL